MSKQLTKLLVLQVLFSLALAHRHRDGHSKEQLKEEDNKYSWEEAEGYKECEDFLTDTEDKDLTKSTFLRKKPKPKALKEICSVKECARTETVEASGCGYSEKILFSGNWITTHINLTRTNGYREAYFRLGGYRSGKTNDRNRPVGMAVPVIKKWYLDENNDVISATMSFYVPSPYQKDPPVSLDKDVTVEQWDDLIIYSRTYGGKRQDPEYMEQFDYLREALTRKKIKTYSYMMMTAGYTSPRYGTQRREVMLIDGEDMAKTT